MTKQKYEYTWKKFIVSQEAVSNVIGFFLIIGILVTSFSILMATQVPQWTKEQEYEHAEKVPQDFAELATTIDMAILRDDPTAPGTRVDMMPGEVPLVGVHASGGTIEFSNSAERFSYMACAPGEVSPPGNPPGWLSTPDDFSDENYTKWQVVKQDYGAELALEIGEDMIFDSGGEEYLAGAFRCNKFAVTKNTKLYTSDLIIYAMNITIESGSQINADGRGSAGGVQDRSGKGGGPGGNNAGHDSAGGGGAGHGGAGGAGGSSRYGDGGAGGSVYGSADNAKEALAGSGGGGGSTGELIQGLSQIIAGEGGNGGGSIFLHASIINIAVAGKLSVNGEAGGDGGGNDDSAGGGGGGGSGGCILLKGDYVTVSGKLYANGGDGGDGGHSRNRRSWVNDSDGGGGGGGAGGIIKIFNDSNLEFSGHAYRNGGDGGEAGDGACHYGGPGADSANGSFYTDGSIPYTPQVRYYDTGYLESEMYDTTTPLVCYGNMTWYETVDDDTNIIMKVRSSIDKNMTYASSWDDCPPVVNGRNISDLSSVSDGHRYIQWRADFITFDLAKTPVLHSVNISYEYGIPYIVNSSGSIRYSSQYTNLPNFKLVYAHGATIRTQTGGEFMLYPPPIYISNHSGITKLKITAINLTNTSNTLSGGFHTTINPSETNSELITGGLYFTNLSINISTDYPDVWRKWFDDTCAEAGLVNGIDYCITVLDEDHLQIAFYGSEARHIKIWLKSAKVDIKLKNKLI